MQLKEPPCDPVWRAVSDPTRLRALEALWEGPKTAKELAASLGVVANRLYYHLRILETAGLVGVVAATLAGRSAERVYGAVARELGSELSNAISDPAANAALCGAMLDAAAIEVRDVVLAQADGRLGEAEGSALHVARDTVRITPRAFGDLVARIRQLYEDAEAAQDADGRQYRLVVAAYAVVSGNEHPH
jgi:DNA-binding transcriptional ArsR family regulator